MNREDRRLTVDWDDELLPVEEVSRQIGLRPVTIYRWCRQGRLSCLKLGKSWRIRRSALDAFLRRAEPSSTLVGQLNAFLTVPDQVLAVTETPRLLARLDAAFFQVAEISNGLLVKIYDPISDSHRALRHQLQLLGLDAERLEATDRLRWFPVSSPQETVPTLRQVLTEGAERDQPIWTAIDWVEGINLEAALQQQAALATLVADHPLVIMTGVVEPTVDTWPAVETQWRLLGSLRGVIRFARAGLVLSRVLPPPAA